MTFPQSPFPLNGGVVSSGVSNFAPTTSTPAEVIGQLVWVPNTQNLYICAGFTPGIGFIWVNLTPAALTNPPTGSLYYNGSAVVGYPLTANLELLGTNGSGSPSIVSLNAGAGVSISQSGSLITITNTAMGVVANWQSVAINTQMVTSVGYIATAAATLTLPATAALGQIVIVNAVVSGVVIACNASQQVKGVGSNTGVGGSLIALTAGSCLILESQNSTGSAWGVISISGSWEPTGVSSTMMQPAGSFTNAGILYLPSLTSNTAALTIPTTPNSTLVSTNTGTPVFQAPATNIVLNNQQINSQGTVYPLAGSAPITATASFTNAAIPYTAAAYTGYSTSIYTPVDATQSFINVTLAIPVSARSTATSTGGQTLGRCIIAAYTSQTATAPIHTAPCGVAGVFQWSDTVDFSFRVSSSAYTSGINLYFCLFFDSSWATSGMQACINGEITSANVTANAAQYSITGALVEDVPSATYNP
jgi:hypothetical protein